MAENSPMINYLIASFRRKIARRVTRKYPTRIDTFQLAGFGPVQFTNWENPLVEEKELSLNHVAFFQQFLQPGDVAIDIGANIGHMTTEMGLAVGPQGLILAFDPNPFVYEILAANTRLNSALTNIQPYNCAISDVEEDFFYGSSEASFNNGGISREKDHRHGKYYLDQKIKGIVLHRFLEEQQPEALDRLRLIKIDTEGYDKEIIRSISPLLKSRRPTVITECFGKNDAAARYEQFELLAHLGYTLYYFSGFEQDAEVVPIKRKEDMMNWKHFDLYAVMES